MWAVRNNMRKKTLKFTETTAGSYAFYWGVADDGYKLLTGDTHKKIDESGMHSTPPWFTLPEAGSYVTKYFPLLKAGLHRKFGSLHDNKSIIEFANRYGLLGENVLLMPHGGGGVTLGESLERWTYESRTMGILLAIWDLVEKRDARKLGQIIIWPNPNTTLLRLLSEYDESQKRWVATQHKGKGYAPGLVTEVLASPEINPELLERWQVGMPVEPAKYYVYHKVNKHLEGHVTPKILPFLEDRIYLFPDSLLAALWVMFLMEITGNIRIRQCDVCGEWKEVALTRSSFYCNNLCRQKAYYERHKLQKEA